MNIPEGILLSSSGEWVLEESDCVLVGLSDKKLEEMGDVVVIELPEVGANFLKDETFATVETVREADELYLPVGGEIVEINEELINSPELLNDDCFENWIVKIAPSDFSTDSEGLMEYDDYIEG